MGKHLIKRFLMALLTIYLIITLSFLMVRFMPGDPLMHLVGEEEYYYLAEFNPEELERMAEKYGCSGTLFEQYQKYMYSILHLDFGIAYSNKQPVLTNMLSSMKWTLILSFPTLIFGGIIGCLLGVIAGWRPGGRFDRIATPVFLFVNTVPTNCIGILAMVFFAFKLRLFPLSGMTSGNLHGFAYVRDVLWHAGLPLMILILFRSSGNFMQMKSYVSQVAGEDYVITARAKGLSERKVLFRHVMKNAMLPFVTNLCLQLGNLFSGSMILETIFGWRGMGQLFYAGVSKRDFPTAQACFIVTATCVVLGNLLGDLICSWIDPRIKEELQ